MHRFHLSVFLKWRPISLPHRDCIQVRLNSTYIRMYCAGSLTHWGRVTHTYVSDPTIIGSDNGLSPRRRQAIIWTNAEILLIGPLGTNFNEILIEIHTFSFKKMHLKMSSVKWRPFCLGPNVLRHTPLWSVDAKKCFSAVTCLLSRTVNHKL